MIHNYGNGPFNSILTIAILATNICNESLKHLGIVVVVVAVVADTSTYETIGRVDTFNMAVITTIDRISVWKS
jgi:hypothetical protein